MYTRKLILVSAAAAAFALVGCRDRSDNYRGPSVKKSEVSTRSSSTSDVNAPTALNTNEPANTAEQWKGSDSEQGIGGSGEQMQPSTAAAPANDTEVLAQLHAINQMEISAGQLAKSNGESKDVKKYGDMLMKDHKKADDDLMKLAKKKNMTVGEPKEPDHDAQAKMDALKDMKGAEFDRQFADLMRDGHDKAIAMVRSSMDASSDKDVKSFLKDLLPKLQHHRDMAVKLLEGKKATGRRGEVK